MEEHKQRYVRSYLQSMQGKDSAPDLELYRWNYWEALVAQLDRSHIESKGQDSAEKALDDLLAICTRICEELKNAE